MIKKIDGSCYHGDGYVLVECYSDDSTYYAFNGYLKSIKVYYCGVQINSYEREENESAEDFIYRVLFIYQVGKDEK